jgi:hypothetical protein
MGLTHEDLAIVLLSPAAPYSQQRLRMEAATLPAEENRPESPARLVPRESRGGGRGMVGWIDESRHPKYPLSLAESV